MADDKYVDGVQATLSAFGKLRGEVEVKIADGLKKCGEIILRKSQQYVPVETGALKASGKVEVTGKGLGTKAFVRYGGPSSPRTADYAPFVHENLEKHHAPPTRAKFLEVAVRETRGTCASVLHRNMAAATKTVKL